MEWHECDLTLPDGAKIFTIAITKISAVPIKEACEKNVDII